MSAQALPPPPFAVPLLDARGFVSRPWQALFTGLYERVGGAADKVDAAHAAAMAAVPQGAQVIASGGLQVGGPLGGNVGISFYKVVSSVALLPITASVGDWCFAADGRKAGEGAGAGTGCPVYWDGVHWIAPDTGATVAA